MPGWPKPAQSASYGVGVHAPRAESGQLCRYEDSACPRCIAFGFGAGEVVDLISERVRARGITPRVPRGSRGQPGANHASEDLDGQRRWHRRLWAGRASPRPVFGIQAAMLSTRTQGVALASFGRLASRLAFRACWQAAPRPICPMAERGDTSGEEATPEDTGTTGGDAGGSAATAQSRVAATTRRTIGIGMPGTEGGIC